MTTDRDSSARKVALAVAMVIGLLFLGGLYLVHLVDENSAQSARASIVQCLEDNQSAQNARTTILADVNEMVKTETINQSGVQSSYDASLASLVAAIPLHDPTVFEQRRLVFEHQAGVLAYADARLKAANKRYLDAQRANPPPPTPKTACS